MASRIAWNSKLIDESTAELLLEQFAYVEKSKNYSGGSNVFLEEVLSQDLSKNSDLPIHQLLKDLDMGLPDATILKRLQEDYYTKTSIEQQEINRDEFFAEQQINAEHARLEGNWRTYERAKARGIKW